MPPRVFTVTSAACNCDECDGYHGRTTTLDAEADAGGGGGAEAEADADGGDAEDADGDLDLDDLARRSGLPRETLADLDAETVRSLDENLGDEDAPPLGTDDEPPAKADATGNMGVLTTSRDGDADAGDGSEPPRPCPTTKVTATRRYYTVDSTRYSSADRSSLCSLTST